MLRKIWEKYYSQCNAVIFVVDGSNESRMEEVKQVLDKLYSRRQPTELVDLPVLFLINKSDDHENYLGMDSVREHLCLSSLNCSREVHVREISASTNENLPESANWLYENIPLFMTQTTKTASSQLQAASSAKV